VKEVHYDFFTRARPRKRDARRLVAENPTIMNAVLRKQKGNLLAYALLLSLAVLAILVKLG